MFADIVCSDPEWVDLEFEALIAGLRNTPRTVSVQPLPPGGAAIPLPDRGAPSVQRRGIALRTRSSIRSPP